MNIQKYYITKTYHNDVCEYNYTLKQILSFLETQNFQTKQACVKLKIEISAEIKIFFIRDRGKIRQCVIYCLYLWFFKIFESFYLKCLFIHKFFNIM